MQNQAHRTCRIYLHNLTHLALTRHSQLSVVFRTQCDDDADDDDDDDADDDGDASGDVDDFDDGDDDMMRVIMVSVVIP